MKHRTNVLGCLGAQSNSHSGLQDPTTSLVQPNRIYSPVFFLRKVWPRLQVDRGIRTKKISTEKQVLSKVHWILGGKAAFPPADRETRFRA